MSNLATVEETTLAHPRMVRMWAQRYIKLYEKEGPAVAKLWAKNLLPRPELEAMAEVARNILDKRKGPPKGP